MNKSETEFANEQAKKMSDLISRGALIEKLEKSIKWCEDNLESSTASFQSGCIATIKDVISTVKMEETCPSVEAEPVVHGHWEQKYTGSRKVFFCSVCGEWTAYGETDYCPFCGARMDKERKEE